MKIQMNENQMIIPVSVFRCSQYNTVFYTNHLGTVYNLYRRHGSLKKELKVKTPIQALEKWFTLQPEIFLKNPNQFEIYLLSLHQNLINQYQQGTSEK